MQCNEPDLYTRTENVLCTAQMRPGIHVENRVHYHHSLLGLTAPLAPEFAHMCQLLHNIQSVQLCALCNYQDQNPSFVVSWCSVAAHHLHCRSRYTFKLVTWSRLSNSCLTSLNVCNFSRRWTPYTWISSVFQLSVSSTSNVSHVDVHTPITSIRMSNAVMLKQWKWRSPRS